MKVKRNIVEDRIRRKRLELMIAGIGYIIGIGIGVWLVIKMFVLGISNH
jgi:hypothetical protein